MLNCLALGHRLLHQQVLVLLRNWEVEATVTGKVSRERYLKVSYRPLHPVSTLRPRLAVSQNSAVVG